MVGLDSPSGDQARVDRVGRAIADVLAGLGFVHELVPGVDQEGQHLHAWLAGEGRARVALLCHHDTVYPTGSAAAGMRRAGDCLLGPGVADMKGGIAVAVHVARLLNGNGHRPFARLELVSVPDEELRSTPFPTIERLIGYDAVLCLECGRSDGSIVTGRKGGRWLRISAFGRAAARRG